MVKCAPLTSLPKTTGLLGGLGVHNKYPDSASHFLSRQPPAQRGPGRETGRHTTEMSTVVRTCPRLFLLL